MFDIFEFFHYWQEAGIFKICRVFWYFIVFELFRYTLFEFVVLIDYTWRSRSLREKREAARAAFWRDMPLISVVAPGKNEGANIFKLVKSLNEQSYTNMEIIIVDDGSDDETPTIGRNLEKNGLIDKFVRNDMRGGKASAANLAWRYCTGDFLLHLDADSSFDRKAIEEIIIPFYMDDTIGGVGGNVKVRNHEESLCATLQAIEYQKTISMGRIVTSWLGIYRIISGAFGAFRMDALQQVGGWDIGPGLDGDITVKLRKSGYKIVFEHRAVCLTAAPVKFMKLFKQRLRWSRSLVRFRLRKHVDVFTPHKGFNWLNFFGFVENVLYNFLLDLKWIVYIIDVAINYPEWVYIILPFNIIMYTLAGYMQQVAVAIFSERRSEEWIFFLYIPLMVPYIAYFLRVCNTLAYFKELFFKASYRDPWNPQKSSYQAVKHGY